MPARRVAARASLRQVRGGEHEQTGTGIFIPGRTCAQRLAVPSEDLVTVRIVFRQTGRVRDRQRPAKVAAVHGYTVRGQRRPWDKSRSTGICRRKHDLPRSHLAGCQRALVG